MRLAPASQDCTFRGRRSLAGFLDNWIQNRSWGDDDKYERLLWVVVASPTVTQRVSQEGILS